MKHYFENPEIYCQNSDMQYSFACQLIKENGLNNSGSILDIGCGDGRITSYMSTLVPKTVIVGLDSSPSMIAYANKRYASIQKNLSFITMKAEAISYRNEFDLVVSFCCLHWVKKQLSALNGIQKALKDNGQILLLIPLKHYELYSAIEEVVTNKKWKSYFNNFRNPHQFFSIEQYSALIARSSIHKVDISEKIMEHCFDNKSSMENWLAAWLPHVKRLPANLKDKFMTDIGNQFIKQIPETETHNVKVPLRMLIIKSKLII